MSSDPETIWDPSGENSATERIKSSPRRGGNICIPNSNGHVIRPRDNCRSIGRECHKTHTTIMALKLQLPVTRPRLLYAANNFGQLIVTEFLTYACVCWSKWQCCRVKLKQQWCLRSIVQSGDCHNQAGGDLYQFVMISVRKDQWQVLFNKILN